MELEDAIHTAILTLKVLLLQNLQIVPLFCIVYWQIKKQYQKASPELFLPQYSQESFEGQMTEDNIELGVCNEQGFRRLTPAEVKDYLASIVS